MARAFLLNAAWEKLRADPQVQSTGYLASWFQESLHPYLTAINAGILDCATQLPITCDGFMTIVQALDSAYPRMDNSTRQLVANWIGRFLTIHQCQESSAKEWIQSNWKSFLNYAAYSDLTKAWSGFDGFSALEVLTASQLAQLTVAHGVLSNATLTGAVAEALRGQDVRHTGDFLSEFSLLPLEGPLEPKALYALLETVLRKVDESFPDLCSPSLKDLFQVKLQRLLPVADAHILELFPTKIGCADFQDIYKGINLVHHELSPATQRAVYDHRLSFLEGQLAKEGAACTFATSSSREWLQENFGLSSLFADYQTLVHLNPSFQGFEVLDLLTAKQIGALVVISGVLTDGARIGAEVEAAAVMRTFQSQNISELRIFLLEVNALTEQRDIAEITNVQVRNVMLQGIFQILKPYFASVVVTDVESWFGGILTLYLPSVTVEELGYLPSPFNCTELQVVFKSFVNITDLMAIDQNFTGMAHLGELSAVQLAQLTLTEEVFSSVANMEQVFAWLAQLPGLSELAAYWDEFNAVYEKLPPPGTFSKYDPNSYQANRGPARSWESRLRARRSLPQPTFVNVVNISMEVKRIMLTHTMERLQVEFPKFTDADYQLWFTKRLAVVLPSVTATILQRIPITMSCEAYKSV
ncbi:hypothetical protein lerEdw1_014101 [Lerista edwardsae]|nr:hypothetical protein lerEdw1_014101 [Lerista edwardsae]